MAKKTEHLLFRLCRFYRQCVRRKAWTCPLSWPSALLRKARATYVVPFSCVKPAKCNSKCEWWKTKKTKTKAHTRKKYSSKNNNSNNNTHTYNSTTTTPQKNPQRNNNKKISMHIHTHRCITCTHTIHKHKHAHTHTDVLQIKHWLDGCIILLTAHEKSSLSHIRKTSLGEYGAYLFVALFVPKTHMPYIMGVTTPIVLIYIIICVGISVNIPAHTSWVCPHHTFFRGVWK